MNRREVAFCAANILAFGLICPSLAQAQLQNQTGIAEPGRVQKQLLNQFQIPQSSPEVSVKTLALPSAPKGAENVKFKFGGLKIEGGTIYTDAQLAAVYKDKIGSEISLADVYGIANQITLKYRNDGYVLTQVVVPPQTIEHGLPRLQVVEGFVDHVVVQSEDKESAFSLDQIKKYASEIQKTKPVNIDNLERQLLIINDLPGVKARSILSPSAATPGGADLLILVKRKAYDALVSVDDYGSRYLGPDQWAVAGTLNSILGLNEAITGQAIIAQDPGDNRELAFGSLKYEMPVGPWGTKVSILGSMTNTTPGYNLEQFDVLGKSNLITLEATQPFIRTRAESLTGRVLFDWRDVDSKNNIEATRKDRVRALRVGAQYQSLDRLFGAGANVFDVEISHGLNVLGGSDSGDANLSRPDGDPEFYKFNADRQRLQRITDSLNLSLDAKAQMSNAAQLSSEEFALGGIGSVRGFDPSEVTGDDGVSGSAELQWKNPFTVPTTYIQKYQLYTFYETGTVWNDDATTPADRRQSLVSAGFGTRFNFISGINGDFALAFPLNQDVQTQGNKHPKVYFSLSKKF